MREKISAIMVDVVDKNNCLPILEENSINNDQNYGEITLTEKSQCFESDDDHLRGKAHQPGGRNL